MNWYKQCQLSSSPYGEGGSYLDYGHTVAPRCPVILWDVTRGRIKTQKITKAYFDKYRRQHGGLEPTHSELFGGNPFSTARGRYDTCTGESSITLFSDYTPGEELEEMEHLLQNAFGNIKLRGLPQHLKAIRDKKSYEELMENL